MTHTPPSLRRAEVSDLPQIRRVLVSAFEHHPLRIYVLPGVHRRRVAISTGDTALFVESMMRGSTWVAIEEGAIVGVIGWLPPEAYPRTPMRGVALMLARMTFLTCPPYGLRALRFQKDVDAMHTKAPALYFTIAATERSRQGRGIASALLRKMTEEADKAGLPIYLETSNHKNLTLYAKHGFEEVGRTSPVPGGPTMVAMLRPKGPTEASS